MNTSSVAGQISATTTASASVVENTSDVAGKLKATTTNFITSLLTRWGGVLSDLEDLSLTGNADTYVIRYNKSDDTYKADKRNLDGGSF